MYQLMDSYINSGEAGSTEGSPGGWDSMPPKILPNSDSSALRELEQTPSGHHGSRIHSIEQLPD